MSTPFKNLALPVIVLLALAFGAVFVKIGVYAALGGAPMFGTVIALFGVLGVVLALGVWRSVRRLSSGAPRTREATATTSRDSVEAP